MTKKIAEVKKEWLERQLKELAINGTSKAETARMLNILPQYLNSIINGNRGITDSFLDKFIETFNVNHFDLLPTLIPAPSSCPLCREKDLRISALKEVISSKDEVLKTKDLLIDQLINNKLS